MSKVICMMGLPRSGKSTVAHELWEELGAPIVNRDSIRLALHGQRYQKEAEAMVKVVAQIMVRALFHAGHKTVIVDETNLKRATRDFWRDGEWKTEFLHVKTSKELCYMRAGAAKDADIMPVIEGMASYAEPLGVDEKAVTLGLLPGPVAVALQYAEKDVPTKGRA